MQIHGESEQDSRIFIGIRGGRRCVRLGFASAPASCGRCFRIRGGAAIERFGERRAIGLRTDKQFNPLFRVFESRVARLEQRNAPFKSSQRFFQSDAAVFQIGDDPLQLGERGLEGRSFGVGCLWHRSRSIGSDGFHSAGELAVGENCGDSFAVFQLVGSRDEFTGLGPPRDRITSAKNFQRAERIERRGG